MRNIALSSALCFIIGLLNITNIYAQKSLSGTVVGSPDNQPLVGANVLIKDPNGKIVVFAITNEGGKFTMNISSAPENATIQVTMMGYKPYSTPLEGKESPLQIQMKEGTFQLKEVKVKTESIRLSGDTVTYNVSSFAQKQDRTIGDVLKRMPGIEVSSNGKIKYQDVDINKFYIEGNDLLEGKYGIATNGISYEDVGGVEVLENHQPMQVLRGISYSEQAAINLKLKNKSKGSLLLNGSLGGGYSSQANKALWNTDLFAMAVFEKRQFITTFKSNNTGDNLANQISDFTSDQRDETMSGYLSLSMPSTPNLARKRSAFNRSSLFSTNHLFKLKNNTDLKTQIDYYYDRSTSSAETSRTYFLQSGEKVVRENKDALSHKNNLKGKVIYEANEKSFYLKNTLSTDLSWNKLLMNTTGTLTNIQEALMPKYLASNDFKMLKRFGNNLLSISSVNEWSSLPERIIVSRDDTMYGQRIHQNAFYTKEGASMGFVFNRLSLYIEGGLSGYFRNLDVKLWDVDVTEGTTGEELTTNYLRLYLSPRLEWNYKKLGFKLSAPINYYSYFFSGGINNRSELFISPSLSTKFQVNNNMSITLRGNLRRSPAALHNIHDSSILTDYRSFQSGIDDYYTSSGKGVSGLLSYRNIHNGLFVIATGRYGWDRSKFRSVQNIDGDYIYYSYRSQPSDTRTASTYVDARKTLMFMRGSVGLKLNYSRSEKNILSQNINTDYNNTTYSLAPYLRGNISSYMNWDLKFTYQCSTLDISDMQRRESNNYIYSGGITLTPCSLITWTTTGEYYNNRTESQKFKKLLMLDSKLVFNVSKRLEISASATNLFNRKEYRYTTYGTISQSERLSRLRGREFLVSVYLKK